MIIQTKEVYKCEYCRKLYQVKTACERHEKFCTKNMECLRPCHSCKHLCKKRETILAGYADFYGNEAERVVECLFCPKLDSFIHTPKVAAKGNAFDMGYKSNVEMPKECEFWEQNEY